MVFGDIDTLTPPLVLAVVFGLSMDYEVFLLSRIRERYEATGDTRRAVAEGLAGSARTITSAALIMVAVFAVFVGTGVPSIKELGVGNAVAIAVDATLVRLVLVPGGDGAARRLELVAAQAARARAAAGVDRGGRRSLPGVKLGLAVFVACAARRVAARAAHRRRERASAPSSPRPARVDVRRGLGVPGAQAARREGGLGARAHASARRSGAGDLGDQLASTTRTGTLDFAVDDAARSGR